MSDPQPMNDAAARSPTGEILDQATSQPATSTQPTQDPARSTEPSSTTNPSSSPAQTSPPATTETKDGTTALTKPADTTKPSPAPETYAAFKAPDGYTIDPKTIEAAAPIFKELGLNQDQAQKLVDFHTAQMIEAAKAAASTYPTLRAEWQGKVLNDAEIKAAASGGKTGIEAVKLDIGRAIGTLDPGLASEFKAAMDLTGAGDHPAFVKAFWKLSQAITEGSHVAGAGPSIHGQTASGTTERPSAAKALYPNLS